MKTILLILAIACVSYASFQYATRLQQVNAGARLATNNKASIPKPILHILFYQDVSQSIRSNGVELISSSVFVPYFSDINRDIELSFGCIADISAHKLISIRLPAAIFSKPEMPDLSNASITERRTLKEQYINDLTHFKTDSGRYFSDRTTRIVEFCKHVDSLIVMYRLHLSPETDLVTAIRVADKAFNFSPDSMHNILILNSDGQDSYGRSITKLNNKTTVILVNASGITHTSIDSIITLTLQSPEDAIQFSLSNAIHQ